MKRIDNIEEKEDLLELIKKLKAENEELKSFRIPQKPTAAAIYQCPRCKINGIEEFERFCPHCGQALDWRNM